jgi:4-alpha-glucanotransferase
MNSFNRVAGVLMHPTSLPGPDGIGNIGPEAYHWINFLKKSGSQLWQILPLGPTGYGDSPYQCFSAFAGNTYLVSSEILVDQGLLEEADLVNRPSFPEECIDYSSALEWQIHLLHTAYRNFKKKSPQNIFDQFHAFRHAEGYWLEDYSLFMALKQDQDGKPWYQWPEPLKRRKSKAIQEASLRLADQIEEQEFWQYLFFSQWERLHAYANRQGIRIVGDMPFVIALDSADVWAEPGLFLMDADLTPTHVAGVPPDYFSVTGQLWGNPLYRWDAHQSQNFQWWVDRLGATLKLVDLVRLDHFRGFVAAWHVPYGQETAVHGEWRTGVSGILFETLKQHFPNLPMIAEDLGVITEDVNALRDSYNLPGMQIMQFGLSGDPEDKFLPHHYPENCFAYTGTHDNNTSRGWFESASPRQQAFCCDYLNCSPREVSWEMMRAIWQSAARNVVAPMQDLLDLPESARMNLPGTESGNWNWRMRNDVDLNELAQRFWRLNFLYSRLPLEQRREQTRRVNQEMEGSVRPH